MTTSHAVSIAGMASAACVALLLWVATPLPPALVVRAAAVAPQSGRSVWDGVYSVDQAARGAMLFEQHCALCHGPTLLGADGPPLTGVEFAGNWNGLTLGALADRIRTSMPPDDPSKLSAQARSDVIAHILNVGGFPTGSAELTRDQAALSAIQFQATKP